MKLFKNNSPTRVIYLSSGKGLIFGSCLEYFKNKKNLLNPVLLITDNKNSKSIQIAHQYNVKSLVLEGSLYKDKKDFNQALMSAILKQKPDLIVTAGYLRLLDADIISRFKNQIINVHPSLLPSFPGLHAQKKALEYGVKIIGCTVHFVDEGIDTGPIINQSAWEVSANMTENEILLKILKDEQRILPKAIELFCKNKLKIQGRKVSII